MEEIEVKILNIQKEKVEEKLRALRAQKIFDGKVEAFYFDFSDRVLDKKKQVVRLRTMREKTFLTVKAPISNVLSNVKEPKQAKIREETEIEVSDLEKTKKILQSLGLQQCHKTIKRRISYALEKVHVEIDQYEKEYSFIPVFMEIEAPTVQLVYAMAERLGFSKEDCKPWSFQDLVEHLPKDHH